MSIIATALRHMLAAGMAHEAILEAVAAMEASLTVTRDVTRDADDRSPSAIRQARYRANLRAKKAGEAAVTGVTRVTESDASRNALSPPAPSPLSSPKPPTNPPPPPTPVGDGAHAHEERAQVGLDLGDKPAVAKPKRKRKKSADDEPFVLPSHIPAECWAGYEAMRNRIRKPMTDYARRLAVKQLEELAEAGHPPGAVLNQSILNSWQGVFAIKDGKNGTGTQQPASGFTRSGSRSEEMDRAVNNLLRRQA